MKFRCVACDAQMRFEEVRRNLGFGNLVELGARIHRHHRGRRDLPDKLFERRDRLRRPVGEIRAIENDGVVHREVLQVVFERHVLPGDTAENQRASRLTPRSIIQYSMQGVNESVLVMTRGSRERLVCHAMASWVGRRRLPDLGGQRAACYTGLRMGASRFRRERDPERRRSSVPTGSIIRWENHSCQRQLGAGCLTKT